jgi:hypothetical protein
VLVGIAEAVHFFDQALQNIAVLSVSTDSQALRLTQDPSKLLGILRWALGGRFLNAVFGAQSQSAHATALFLVGRERYIRIDPYLSKSIPLDGYKDATQLLARGVQAGRTYLNQITRDFLTAAPNLVLGSNQGSPGAVGSTFHDPTLFPLNCRQVPHISRGGYAVLYCDNSWVRHKRLNKT